MCPIAPGRAVAVAAFNADHFTNTIQCHGPSTQALPMLSLLFLPFDVFQLLASLELLRHYSLRGVGFALSLDFTLYSWVWALSHTIANFFYCFLPTARAQYVARYPLYSGMPLSQTAFLLSLLQLCLCTHLAIKCFFRCRSKEHISVVCTLVLATCYSFFLWVLWLYVNGMATVKILDLADCLHNIGSIALAFRLVPQISLNWFHETFFPTKAYLVMQATGAACATLALYSAYSFGYYWYELPISLPSQAVLWSTWGALVVLMWQRRYYGQRKTYSNSYNIV